MILYQKIKKIPVKVKKFFICCHNRLGGRAVKELVIWLFSEIHKVTASFCLCPMPSSTCCLVLWLAPLKIIG